jgi:flagellar biosynthesis/type III secretory pathway protein FliH
MTNAVLTWTELKMNLAQRMVQWEKDFYTQGHRQGQKEGIHKGLLQGQALSLQRLLTLGFGKLSAATRKRLDQARSEVFRAEG